MIAVLCGLGVSVIGIYQAWPLAVLGGLVLIGLGWYFEA